MELLILKSGSEYIRIKEDMPLRVRLDKASVFPMDQLEKVKKIESTLLKEGFEDVRIKKLILSEEDL